MRSAIDRLHRFLARYRFAVRAAIYIRNQADAVVGKHVGETHDQRLNGEFKLVDVLAPYCSVVVDVGANVGAWTEKVRTSVPAENGLRIYLFEPAPAAYEELFNKYGSCDDVHLFKKALGHREEEAIFAELPGLSELSSIVRTSVHEEAKLLSIKTSTLDVFAAANGLDAIDLLKIDTEGYDYRVLQGALELLHNQRIRVLQFEYNSCWAAAGSTLAKALQLLSQNQYHVYLLRSTGLFEFDYELYGEYFRYSNFVALLPGMVPEVAPHIRGRL